MMFHFISSNRVRRGGKLRTELSISVEGRAGRNQISLSSHPSEVPMRRAGLPEPYLRGGSVLGPELVW